MADLIDRAALLEKKTTLWDDSLGWTECVDIDDIEAAPAVDAVPVVRRKDCKHSHNYPWGGYSCSFHEYEGEPPVEPDDFCSYGERRTDGKTD